MTASRNIYFATALALGVSFALFQLLGKGRLWNAGVPFDMVNVEGRGKGLVATRDIPQGQLILSEDPLFILEDKELNRRLPSVLSSLNKTAREVFFQLSFPSDTPNSNIPQAIWRTNGIAVNGGDELAILPLVSRINHGCSHAANAVLDWRDGHAVLHAIKPIKKGGEILREYIPSKYSRKTRRELLSEQYGFHCTCSICNLPPVESERSDIRLSSIALIEERVHGWNETEENADPNEIVRLAKRVWGLGESEGYWMGRGRLAEEVSALAAAHHEYVFLRFTTTKDAAQMLIPRSATACAKWAQLSSQWYAYEFGYDSIPAVRMRQVGNEPSKNVHWGSRTARKVEGPDS